MAFLTGSRMGVVGNPGDIHTTQRNALGARSFDELGNEYIYLAGVASTVANDWVAYDEVFASTRTLAATLGPCAIASAAIVASNWGWYGLAGKFTGTSGTIADNGHVYSTSTAGSVDDAAVQGSRILGAIARSSDSGGVATFQIQYPMLMGILEPTT